VKSPRLSFARYIECVDRKKLTFFKDNIFDGDVQFRHQHYKDNKSSFLSGVELFYFGVAGIGLS